MNSPATKITIMCSEERIRDFYWQAYFAALAGLRSDLNVDADLADAQADLSARRALARAGVVLT